MEMHLVVYQWRCDLTGETEQNYTGIWGENEQHVRERFEGIMAAIGKPGAEILKIKEYKNFVENSPKLV